MFISIVIAIVSVVGLLTLHEFGHFIIAKRVDICQEICGRDE